MATHITLSERDFALLRLLEMTPATASHIRKASATFHGEPFRDDRRVRERLQTLAQSGFTKTCSAALIGGGSAHYYRLSPFGYRAIHPDAEQLLPKSLNADIAPSRFQHAMTTADVIVHTLLACHGSSVRVLQFMGDGKLTLEVGEYRQQPDCHFQLEHAGCFFNFLFEVDNATEPIDSRREQSIRVKILGYESYMDWVLHVWKNAGRAGIRPSFRVVFLTKSATRANHILYLAQSLARNKDRRLVIATTQDVFLGCSMAATLPIVNDHHGHWQSLVNVQPSAGYGPRPPIRLQPPVAQFGIV
jgi:hypothetical protein